MSLIVSPLKMQIGGCMKYLFTCLTCLICGMGFAETIQDIDYHLPENAKNWVVGNRLENEKSVTIIYIPGGIDRQEVEEFFGVSANHLVSNLNDVEPIKTSLVQMFPTMSIDFRILEKDAGSVLYEWSGKEGGVEKIHGLGRGFSSKEGTVILSYQTDNPSKINETRSTWLASLKEAKKKS